ncbi:addiction module toxin RelE [Bifidobacterium eulemuris]|uniref:Addiction module toxin RelE n=1 Tax=Bifidobacterium eulemuris TaxID=1765219 RepID=A0A261G797_9BIFI|nr:addiction module toxin RelE [Bifidobacterium eulemuris]QOL32871.1 type II toxin-antitoxin system YafQ family toxin [Bifidobacterium eulemuris]
MVEVRFTPEFSADLARLSRWRVDYAREVRDVVADFLATDGCVPDSYGPHVLNKPGGCYNGCVEFHMGDDDVLVLYWRGRGFVRMVRICSHAELSACRFGVEWPRGDSANK